jgi:prophage regulatory protein
MTNTMINELAAAIAQQIPAAIPLSVDLWSTNEIAAYLKRGRREVAERIVALPGFPQAIRLPTTNRTKSHPLWKAVEVIAWTERHQEKRTA